jgi:cell division protein FtsN
MPLTTGEEATAPESRTPSAPPPATSPAEAPRAEAERQPATSAAPERSPSLGRSLQVGAFQNAENARTLAATLSARFPDVRVVTVPRGGVFYHCVRLGGFADAYALAARADALRAAGYSIVYAPE